MAFFDEFGRTVRDAASVAAEKAKDIAAQAADKAKSTAERTKLSVSIAAEQREIERNCRLIGSWFVSEYDGELPEAVRGLAESVNACKARIAQLEERRSALGGLFGCQEEPEDGQRPCPVCGCVSDSRFCPQCGAPMD